MHAPLFAAVLLCSTLIPAAATEAPPRVGSSAPAVAMLPAKTHAAIDAIVVRMLAATGEPSVSIAVVKDGKLVYSKAYGKARLPGTPATPATRYKIGSLSKQFTAAAMLLLEQDGKLSLDDKVGKYFPELTRAQDVTLRQLLNHTAGYEDFYPLDILTQEMQRSIAADDLMHRYGKRPLGFEPGTRWAYSNTNYVIAGRIIEKASGMPLHQFMQTRIAARLNLASMTDTTKTAVSSADAIGYGRHALAAPRVAPAEGKGWTYATGHLAMTASDLARWNLALLNNTLLSPESRAAMTRPVAVKESNDPHYALGLGVETLEPGRVRWSHNGGTAGFISRNVVYPQEKLAIVVLTNSSNMFMAGAITSALEDLLLPPAPPAAAAAPEPASAAVSPPAADKAAEDAKALVMSTFAQLQRGAPHRRHMTRDLDAYFTKQVVRDYADTLRPLGPVTMVRQLQEEKKGQLTSRLYMVKTEKGMVAVFAYFTAANKLAQFNVTAAPVQ